MNESEIKTTSLELEKTFNKYYNSSAELAYRFATTAHRAIQEDAAHFAIEYLLMLGEMYHSGQYDVRNEFAAKLGSEILQCANAIKSNDPDNEFQILRIRLKIHQKNADKAINGKFY